ncbi:MAG: hypothetical protein ABIH99_05055 [Candidatus Micrarchaeota archaeon]
MNGPITREIPNIAEKPTVKNHYIREALQRYARKNWKLGAGLLFSFAVIAAALTFIPKSNLELLKQPQKAGKNKAPLISAKGLDPVTEVRSSEELRADIKRFILDSHRLKIGIVRAGSSPFSAVEDNNK